MLAVQYLILTRRALELLCITENFHSADVQHCNAFIPHCGGWWFIRIRVLAGITISSLSLCTNLMTKYMATGGIRCASIAFVGVDVPNNVVLCRTGCVLPVLRRTHWISTGERLFRHRERHHTSHSRAWAMHAAKRGISQSILSVLCPFSMNRHSDRKGNRMKHSLSFLGLNRFSIHPDVTVWCKKSSGLVSSAAQSHGAPPNQIS